MRRDGLRMRAGTALAAALLALAGGARAASEVVEQNPFDPGRKPWKQEKEAAPALPELTPKDLQIDAIIAFGQFRGIVAQLDGKLKGALPANAAGKVRIQVGQNFGGGYVLAAIEANHAVVQSGDRRFTVPLLRKISRGGPPSPAAQAPAQLVQPMAEPVPTPGPGLAVPATPFAMPVPGSAPGAMPGSAPVAADGGTPPPSPPPAEAAPAQAAAASPAQPSLLEALMKAREASPARGALGVPGAAQGGMPFGGKQ